MRTSHQVAVWKRQQTGNKLRSLSRECYPAALIAFPDLAQPVGIEVLQLAPTRPAPRS